MEGPVAHAIKGLMLSEVNYVVAIELMLIRERFGRTKQIISVHIDKFLKLPSCNDDNVAQI